MWLSGVLSFLLFIIYSTALIQGQDVDNGTALTIEASPDPTTLIGLLGTPDYRLLNKLVTVANLSDVLEGSAERTLFAPNNDAFLTSARSFGSFSVSEDAAFDAVVNVLNVASDGKISEIARKVILYHIVASKEGSLINTTKTLTTQSDDLLIATGTGELESLSTPNAKIVSNPPSDVENWLVYTIDNILFPFLITSSTKSTAAKSPAPVAGGVSGTIGGTTPVISGAGASTDTTNEGNQGRDVGGNNSTAGGSVCFPADARVKLSDGRLVTMEEVEPCDLILVDANKKYGFKYSAVFGFTHRKSTGYYDFIRISTHFNLSITLSANHYIYANDVTIPAKDVRVGDVLRTEEGEGEVISTKKVRRRGLYAPHTFHGDIVVQGIQASCYTELFARDAAHGALSPVRSLVKFRIFKEPLGSLFYNGLPHLSFNIPTVLSTSM